MVAISPRLAQRLRRTASRFLTHRCTVTPMVPGAEDTEGNMPLVPGTPVTDVPCLYTTDQRAVRDEGGVTLVATPVLMAAADGPVAVGVRIAAVTDQLGNVLLAGPARVERLVDDTAGLGSQVLPSYELRAGTVS